MKYCPNCGAKMNDEVNFCSNCGERFNKEEAISKKTNNYETKREQQLSLTKADLLLWFKFYQKCRALEKSLPFSDYDSSKGNQSGDLYPDITLREFKIPEHYFSQAKSEYKSEYVKSHENEIDEEYFEYVKTNMSKNKKQNRFITKTIRYFKECKKGLVDFVSGILFLLFSILFFVLFANNANQNKFYSFFTLIVAAIFLVVSIALLILSLPSVQYQCGTFPIYKSDDNGLGNQKPNLINKEEFFEKKHDFENDIKYKQGLVEIGYRIHEDDKEIRKEIKQLGLIREDIRSGTLIPEAYQNEFSVCSLLDIIIKHQADTFTEAVQQFETEKYRLASLRKLDAMDQQLKRINSSVSNINQNVRQIEADNAYYAERMGKTLSDIYCSNQEINNKLKKVKTNSSLLVMDRILNGKS